ncbi:response regulator, partial [Patescibacteria group bacterium]|nr:response regulator [Patescibacteria group bacterium]
MFYKYPFENKKILIVDDEPDVLETLEDLLSFCEIAKASNFEDAKKLLETRDFDITILGIMGVNGYELLRIAIERKVIPVMLTAHALSPENTIKSFKEGAVYYFPKDVMSRIAMFLYQILEEKEGTVKLLVARLIDKINPWGGPGIKPDFEDQSR